MHAGRAGRSLDAACRTATATEPAQDENLAYAIGVQTYISGFPMMDLYRTLWETSFDPERGHDRTLNEFFVFDRLVTSADDWVVTANQDVIYLRAFLDLRGADHPRDPADGRPAILDAHRRPVARLRCQPVMGHGRFARWRLRLVPARMAGPASRRGRAGRRGHADHLVAAPLRSGRRCRRAAGEGVPEAGPARPPQPVGAATVTRPQPNPADFPRFTRNELTDAKAYFTTLNKVLRLSPRLGHPMDEAMAGWLREIGMDPATGFDWDQLSPQARRGLERATADAHRIIAERMPRVMPTLNHWQVIRLDKRMSGDPMIAASGAMLGLLWNPREVNTYDLTFFDGSGVPLDGSNRYILRFDPPPPVNAFWSVTMYSAETRTFVPNVIDRYTISDRTPGTVVGQDGSIDILPPGRSADRSGRARELAPCARGALLPRVAALLSASRDPDGGLVAPAGGRPLRSVISRASVLCQLEKDGCRVRQSQCRPTIHGLEKWWACARSRAGPTLHVWLPPPVTAR